MKVKSSTDVAFMRRTIEKTIEGIKKGQSPFGALIVKEGKIISLEHNCVWRDCDITCHAEVHAIRSACTKLKSVTLTGCTIYSTCEPCPMCFSACHWAQIDKIIYGASIKDAQKTGFRELTISNRMMKKLGKSQIKIKGGVLKKECADLFTLWLEKGQGSLY